MTIIELGSAPNEQMQLMDGPEGIENLQNDQVLEKYFGKICEMFFSRETSSSRLKTWIVPWSLATTTAVDWWLKLMQ